MFCISNAMEYEYVVISLSSFYQSNGDVFDDELRKYVSKLKIKLIDNLKIMILLNKGFND
jgi:hypothetical protein